MISTKFTGKISQNIKKGKNRVTCKCTFPGMLVVKDHKSYKRENIMFKPGPSQNRPNKSPSLTVIAFGDRNFTKVIKVKKD